MTATIDHMPRSPHFTFRAPRDLIATAKAISEIRKENLSLHVLRPALEAYVAEHQDELRLDKN